MEQGTAQLHQKCSDDPTQWMNPSVVADQRNMHEIGSPDKQFKPLDRVQQIHTRESER